MPHLHNLETPAPQRALPLTALLLLGMLLIGGWLLWRPLALPTSMQTAPSETNDSYQQAIVTAILQDNDMTIEETQQPFQQVRVRVLTGPQVGRELELDHGGYLTITAQQKVAVGERVVLLTNENPSGTPTNYIADKLRLAPLALAIGLFFVLAFVLGRKQGFLSSIGLVFSLIVLTQLTVPALLRGWNPILVSLVSALLIICPALLLAHQVKRRTLLALAGVLLTLVLAGGLALLLVSLTKLTGMGSEDAYLLQLGPTASLNLRGLLLGGIIIGVLGVLDDVATTQVAAVDELRIANPNLPSRELYRRGMQVGREHIASLVNTLVLAYAGAALPLFIILRINQATPSWVIFNGEFLAEEVIRTVVGSAALMLAVPISTALAAWHLQKNHE